MTDRSWGSDHRGAVGTCIAVSAQGYRDGPTGLAAVDRNRRLSRDAWDPDEPRQLRQGLEQRPCEDPGPTCDEVFIGDFFALQVSATSVYVLSTTTHFPGPGARSDHGHPIYYQRAVLHTVPRDRLGL